MSALSRSFDIDYLQVGKGRLGGLIAQQVKHSLGQIDEIQTARIDPDTGLIDLKGSSLTGAINRLVICISAGKKQSWQWHQLLTGMLAQKDRGELKINQLIFISSTAVYDGIQRGVVCVDTPAIARSERAKSLLRAENQIKLLANTFHIVRCSGLYGRDYQKYLAILSSPALSKASVSQDDDQPRFGVNVESVAETVLDRLRQNSHTSSYSLLTDGYCYFQGHKTAIGEANELALKHRLLFPGCLHLD